MAFAKFPRTAAPRGTADFFNLRERDRHDLRRDVLGRFQLVLKMIYRFDRVEVKDDSTIRGPLVIHEVENSRGRAQIADGFDFFHAAALDGSEADRYGNEGS